MREETVPNARQTEAAKIQPASKWKLISLALPACLLAALVFPLVFNDRFTLHVAIMFLLYAIGALAVHLVIRCGNVSLCQAAFMGIGAYTSVLTNMVLGFPWLLSAACGVLAAAGAGLLIGPIIMRLSGKYFVLVTFLTGEIVRMVFSEWQGLTGGANGISEIPPPSPLFLNPVAYYYLVLAATVIVVTICVLLLHSPFGRVINSVRESERLARCSGVPVLSFKVMVFTIACGLNGLGGVLHAHYVRYIEPVTYGVLESLNFVVINVLGGMMKLAGPFIGSIFVVVLPELLRDTVLYQKVVFGVLLIIVMAFYPGGLAEAGSQIVNYLRRRGRDD